MEDIKNKINPQLNIKMIKLSDDALEEVSGGIIIPAPFSYFHAHCTEPGCGWESNTVDAHNKSDRSWAVGQVMDLANVHSQATGHFDFEVIEEYPCDL